MTLDEMHMRVQRFRFTSFDAGKPESQAAFVAETKQQKPQEHPAEEQPLENAPPPPPMFSEQEMSLAKMASYQEGLRAGQLEAESQRNKEEEASAASLRALQEVIANRITLASEEHTQLFKKHQEMLVKLSIGIARKVAGDALKREPYASVESLLKECLSLIMNNERITLAVPPAKSEGLRQSIDSVKQHLQDYQGEITIESDPALGEYDCRVEWGNGRAVKNTEQLWAEIEALVKKTPLTNF